MDFAHPLRAVTPTLDGDVLHVLAQAEKSFTGREVQRLTHASQEGVRRVLERLVGQGVVASERAGRATLYRLNRAHLAAPQIIALAALRLRFIEALRAELQAWRVEPQTAAIFGSVARGDADAESDVDLLIVRPSRVDPDDPVWRSQITALESAVESWTGNEARALEYGADEFAGLRGREPVIQSAVREAIIVFGAFPPR